MVSWPIQQYSDSLLAEKTNGVFKSVNKDRRPDTLLEKKYQVNSAFIILGTYFRKAGMWAR